MVRITHFSTSHGHACAQQLRQAIAERSMQCSIERAQTVDTPASHFEHATAALLQGRVEAVVLPLTEVPIEKPEGVVVTAVLPRRHPGAVLLVQPSLATPQHLLALPAGARVHVADELQALRLTEVRPDVQAIIDEIEAEIVLENLKNKRIEAAILPTIDIENLAVDRNDWINFPLHPAEFLPLPGQGITAVLALKNDFATRRQLKKIHHPPTAATGNVERGIFQFLKNQMLLRAYCHRDALGYFHASAEAWCLQTRQKRSANLSSATSAGLSAELAQNLN